MLVTREFVRSVRERLTENPAVPLFRLAEELHASEAAVVTAMPVHMRLRARCNDAGAIWKRLVQWSPDVVNCRKVPDGSGRVSSSGRAEASFAVFLPELREEYGAVETALNVEEVGSVWFVSRPLNTEERLSVRFFDKQGGHLLSVYMGGEVQGAIGQRAGAEYEALRERFGVTPVPRIRCKGCGSCACANSAPA
jgi:putative heme iron utilization protein